MRDADVTVASHRCCAYYKCGGASHLKQYLNSTTNDAWGTRHKKQPRSHELNDVVDERGHRVDRGGQVVEPTAERIGNGLGLWAICGERDRRYCDYRRGSGSGAFVRAYLRECFSVRECYRAYVCSGGGGCGNGDGISD